MERPSAKRKETLFRPKWSAEHTHTHSGKERNRKKKHTGNTTHEINYRHIQPQPVNIKRKSEAVRTVRPTSRAPWRVTMPMKNGFSTKCLVFWSAWSRWPGGKGYVIIRRWKMSWVEIFRIVAASGSGKIRTLARKMAHTFPGITNVHTSDGKGWGAMSFRP